MKHLPSDFRYSFSKLASFKQCPMSFYLTYIKDSNEDEIPNYFSQYGSFAHKLIEQWAKDELPAFCLAEEWEKGYDKEVSMPPPPFPKGMAEKYYNAAMDYFKNFDGFGDEYEIISVEKKFVLQIDGYNVSGIADLVLCNKKTHEIWVIDHKSKSMNSLKKEKDLYRKQLYLYAMWVHAVCGAYPTRLSFNMFKEGCFVDEEFDIEEMYKARQWFIDTIHEIEECDVFGDWQVKYNSYFCGQICSVAHECETYAIKKQEELEKWKAKQEAMNNGFEPGLY